MNEHPDNAAAPGGDDEFRRRLKDLGYLANPLDKFFIGGAHGRTGVFVANLKVALKVGVLGGVFLGVVTAIGLVTLAPETYSGLAVAAKLALYFSLVFTALFTVLELVICLAVTALGRNFRRLFTRTEMIALYSGLFAGLVTVVYGTLWWWAGAAEAGTLSGQSLAVLAVVIVLAVVLAVLTRLAVTALLALLGGADLAARGKGRATKLYFLVLIAGVAVFAGFRLATVKTPPREPSAYERAPSQLSVTLIAIDGGYPEFFARLAGRGECPNLASLARNGFLAQLAPPEINVNPAVWTTVATGVTPVKHGVTSYGGQEIAGLGLYIKDRVGFGLYDALLSALPAVGLSRRAPLERTSLAFPAVWDVLAQKGDLSGVVNWWGTWPASGFHGFLVTDRMYPKLQVAKATSAAPVFEEEAYPRALFDRLASYEVTASKVSEDPLAAAEDIDKFAVTAALEAAPGYGRVALTAVYLPGLDIYENTLYSAPRASPELVRAAGVVDLVSSYWRFLDGVIAPLVARAGPTDVVIVVCDPGMLKGEERSSGRRDRGFVIISGGPSIKGGAGSVLAAVDITPAVLYLLGFPVSAEMDGRVPLETFDEAFVASHPVARVATFGRLAARPEETSKAKYSVDAELVERLKSLGYLQ